MIKIYFFDKNIVVCEKPRGILSQADASGGRNLPDILKKETNSYYIEAVHRLDRPVGGVMVYARNKKSAAVLGSDIQNHRFQKEYLAVVHGKPEQDSGDMVDFLYKDRQRCKSYVVKTLRTGAKEARLSYKVLGTHDTPDGVLSLVSIVLHTGRTHQIRVQFSSRQMPLVGDERYGGKDDKCDIALFSHTIAFNHPITHKPLEFTAEMPGIYPFNLFKI